MYFKNKNICILTYSLGRGGAEKVAAIQSQMLDNLGYRVFIVSVLNDIQYEYAGELLNLGSLKDQKDGFFPRIHRLYTLKKFLSKNKIDLLIDHRSRNVFLREILLKLFLFRKIKTLFVIHNHNLKKSFPDSRLLARFLYENQSTMVAVSKSIVENIKTKYGLINVKTIYNAFEPKQVLQLKKTQSENYILFFGRFDEDAKDLTFLIKAYRESILVSKNIKLQLLGDGKDKHKIIKLVSDLGLEKDVIFTSYTNNPLPIVQKAIYTVLTSNYEGFPMAIVESLACKTPVVSVDCESGPREIITHEHNGLLVKKELTTYTKALNRMVTDKDLLRHCKKNCLKSIEHLSFDNIKEQWKELIDEVLD